MNNHQSILVPEFNKYGRIITEIDFTDLCNYARSIISIPSKGNEYNGSLIDLEDHPTTQEIRTIVYGALDIQVGSCCGHNRCITAVEYHQGSETIIALTDCLLKLGHRCDIINNTYQESKMETFFLRSGEAVELFSTTLHYSPMETSHEGYAALICLPQGTNSDISVSEVTPLVKKKNKFMLVSPQRLDKIKEGYIPGFITN